MFKLIAVTDEACCSRPLLQQVQRLCACSCPPAVLLLRAKELKAAEYEALALQALPICQKYGVHLLLHSHWQWALRLGTGSVHLPLPLLRRLSPQERSRFACLSTSVHSLEDIALAEQGGATMLLAGHIFATACKPGLPPRGLGFLRQVCSRTALPVYAIGGIGFDAGQWQELQLQGAAGACIRSGYMRI